jgi:hypothetical protein
LNARAASLERGATVPSNHSSLRNLLAEYDLLVDEELHEVLKTTTGLDRVRLMHNTLLRSIAVHDAVLESALCPLLEDLPGGRDIADRLRRGCQVRADLARRFKLISSNIAAHNVYPVSGEETEQILVGLQESFRAHADDETLEVGDVLEAAAESTDVDVVATRMAIEAARAPTRVHAATARHPRSSVRRSFNRRLDRLHDWSASHGGWSDPHGAKRSPRQEQVAFLKAEAFSATPSVQDLLAGYDRAVDATIDELTNARTSLDQAEAGNRLNAAITIHDAVLGAVLCPLLEAVPGGESLAVRLRAGCHRRAELQEAWAALAKAVPPEDLYVSRASEANAIIDPLVESFRSHETDETSEGTELLKEISDESYRTKGSLVQDAMWPWHSEGPSVLALRMALLAQSTPSHAHSALESNPNSSSLRTYYRFTDHFRDRWADTWAGKFFLPEPPPRPFSDQDQQRKSDTDIHH